MIKIEKSNLINNYGTKIAFIYRMKNYKYHHLGNKPARIMRIGGTNSVGYTEIWIDGDLKGIKEFVKVI